MIDFKFWRAFRAFRDKAATRAFLTDSRTAAVARFKAGMISGPHTGNVYVRPGRIHRASAPGEYPAKDFGPLLRSLRSRQDATEIQLGTNTPYARYLRLGTAKMRGRRAMSDTALQETTPITRARARSHSRFKFNGK